MPPPFTVLHVCVGNICRSPMAERLLVLALRRYVGAAVDQRYLSHGAGTGSWHAGEAMNPPAARQLRERGGDPDGFRARQVTVELIDGADLVLCATREQVRAVLRLRPKAAARTFVLGEFGRLLADLDLTALPPAGDSTHAARERGVALVAAVDAGRDGGGRRRPAEPDDDLDDPWGLPDQEYARTADQIERTVHPLAAALAGVPPGDDLTL